MYWLSDCPCLILSDCTPLTTSMTAQLHSRHITTSCSWFLSVSSIHMRFKWYKLDDYDFPGTDSISMIRSHQRYPERSLSSSCGMMFWYILFRMQHGGRQLAVRCSVGFRSLGTQHRKIWCLYMKRSPLYIHCVYVIKLSYSGMPNLQHRAPIFMVPLSPTPRRKFSFGAISCLNVKGALIP